MSFSLASSARFLRCSAWASRWACASASSLVFTFCSDRTRRRSNADATAESSAERRPTRTDLGVDCSRTRAFVTHALILTPASSAPALDTLLPATAPTKSSSDIRAALSPKLIILLSSSPSSLPLSTSSASELSSKTERARKYLREGSELTISVSHK